VDDLPSWLAWLGITGCACPWEWRGTGRLYGQDLGKGWIRMRTAADCPHHQA
jgi:hypothetical protein